MVNLNGGGYGGPPPAGLSGYNVTLDDSWGVGYVLGAALLPEISEALVQTLQSGS